MLKSAEFGEACRLLLALGACGRDGTGSGDRDGNGNWWWDDRRFGGSTRVDRKRGLDADLRLRQFGSRHTRWFQLTAAFWRDRKEASDRRYLRAGAGGHFRRGLRRCWWLRLRARCRLVYARRICFGQFRQSECQCLKGAKQVQSSRLKLVRFSILRFKLNQILINFVERKKQNQSTKLL